jgi:beta-phosphoglucomutase-like phosphatase (HAD superfamily)
MARPKTIMVDMDGVLASEERTFERALAKPLDGAREALQRLRAAGHTIIVYTARGWAEYRMTKAWLDDNGFVHDGLHMGKPIADLWIDDRALRHTGWPQTLDDLAALGVELDD